MSTVKQQLLSRAKAIENDRCDGFPFQVICNEVPGLSFNDFCESCQARVVMKAFRETGNAEEQGDVVILAQDDAQKEKGAGDEKR